MYKFKLAWKRATCSSTEGHKNSIAMLFQSDLDH